MLAKITLKRKKGINDVYDKKYINTNYRMMDSVKTLILRPLKGGKGGK